MHISAFKKHEDGVLKSYVTAHIPPGHSADSSKILHAALANPVSVLSMPVSVSQTKAYWLDLSSLFPIATGMWSPHLNMAPLPRWRMLLHEGLASYLFTTWCLQHLTCSEIILNCMHRATVCLRWMPWRVVCIV